MKTYNQFRLDKNLIKEIAHSLMADKIYMLYYIKSNRFHVNIISDNKEVIIYRDYKITLLIDGKFQSIPSIVKSIIFEVLVKNNYIINEEDNEKRIHIKKQIGDDVYLFLDDRLIKSKIEDIVITKSNIIYILSNNIKVTESELVELKDLKLENYNNDLVITI
jgi:hypothetical protein